MRTLDAPFLSSEECYRCHPFRSGNYGWKDFGLHHLINDGPQPVFKHSDNVELRRLNVSARSTILVIHPVDKAILPRISNWKHPS